MIQFECPRVIYPLLLFNIGVHCGVSISLYAGKGNCCIWTVNKVEIHFAKIRLWTANGPIWLPQGHTPLGVTHFLGPLWWMPVSWPPELQNNQIKQTKSGCLSGLLTLYSTFKGTICGRTIIRMNDNVTYLLSPGKEEKFPAVYM